MSDPNGLPPLHLQLAGPAARPHGHPDHHFVVDGLAIGEYPTPEDAPTEPITAYGVTGWLEDETAPTVEDRVTIPLA